MQRPVSVSTSCVPNPDAALFDSFARAGVACAEISLPGRNYAAFPYAECVRWARDAGVAVAVETHDSWTDSTQLRAVFEKAGWPEGVGFLWDVHHPYRFHGEPPETSAANMGGHLLNTHWKDSAAKADGGFELRLCGEGDVPLREIARTLHAAGYGGYLTFEWEKRWHSEIPGPEVAVPHFARFIRQVAADCMA